MQSQTAFVEPSGWPQQQQQQHVQQNGAPSHQHGMHRHSLSQHAQQQQQQQQHTSMSQQMNTTDAVSGPMAVDQNGGFFSGEVKRHLFW